MKIEKIEAARDALYYMHISGEGDKQVKREISKGANNKKFSFLSKGFVFQYFAPNSGWGVCFDGEWKKHEVEVAELSNIFKNVEFILVCEVVEQPFFHNFSTRSGVVACGTNPSFLKKFKGGECFYKGVSDKLIYKEVK